MPAPLLPQLTNAKPLSQEQYNAIIAVYAGPKSPANGNSFFVNLYIPIVNVIVPIDLKYQPNVNAAVNYCEASWVYTATGTVGVGSKSINNPSSKTPQYAANVAARTQLIKKMAQDAYGAHTKQYSLSGILALND